jgi:electron-transferring-flavoprotein dehydrogenase
MCDLGPRDKMVFDAVIVGGGPAGLSCSIRMKQLAAEQQRDISVCVIEKGAEPGAHILSGETRSGWKEWMDRWMDTCMHWVCICMLDSHYTCRHASFGSSRFYLGNVFETRALNELIPDWCEKDPPSMTPVSSDTFLFLTEKGSYKIPNWTLPSELV